MKRREFFGVAAAAVSGLVLPIPQMPAAEATNLRVIYKWNNREWVRVRMAELRLGDLCVIQDLKELWRVVRNPRSVPGIGVCEIHGNVVVPDFWDGGEVDSFDGSGFVKGHKP